MPIFLGDEILKILITSDWYAPTVNGVVTSVLNLENKLRELGHDVRILTLSESIHSHKKNNVYYERSVKAPVYPEARAGIMSKEHYKEILEWGPDIIHTQCEFSTYIAARKIAKKLDIPMVHTYHTVYEDYTHYFCPSKRLGRKIVSVLTRKLLKCMKAVIVPTEKVRELIAGYGVDKDIYVLPTGIDLDKYSKTYSEDEILELRRKHNIPRDNKIMLFLGRLAKEKNIPELMEYFKRLDRADLTFLIVGGGPYYDELREKAKKICGDMSVIFTGMISPEQVGKYYKSASFFVNASTSETQGLTYIETLASGLPALCRKDGCIKGVVIDNVNGFQYENYEDFSRFAAKILDNADFRASLSEGAVKTSEVYSTLSFAKKALGIYEAAIKHHSAL